MTTNSGVERREVDFDHTDQAYANDSSERFRHLRDECPVAHTPAYGGFWVMTRYDDITASTRDPELFSSAQGVQIPDVGSGVPLPPLQADPPSHTYYRKVLQQEFTARRMRGVEGFIRDLTRELMDEFGAVRSIDLVERLATPLPPIVIAQLMGFPREDWTVFREQLEIMINAAMSDNPEAGQSAAVEFLQHLAGALAERRAEPRDDMLTRIASCELDGRPITDEEALGMTWTTVVAGHETTVGGIGALLMHVGQDPDLKARLLADPGLIPQAVEETVRLEAPITGMRRNVTRDVCLHGQQLLAGEDVWLSYAAANRDDRKFDQPDTFDLDRTPNHVGFGDGIHRCVGAPLARLEMRVVLEEMLDRFPTFTVDPDAELRFQTTQSRRLLNLPVRW